MIQMETPKKDGPTFPVDYAHSIKYENREQEELSSLDVAAIRRFRKKYSDDDALMNQDDGLERELGKNEFVADSKSWSERSERSD